MAASYPPDLSSWAGDPKYEIRGTLGSGAHGVVLDAFDRTIERRVAIKVIRKPEMADAEAVEAQQRFRQEARAAGRLSHPGIVAVYDYGEDERTAWIVMEMVEGGSLKELLDRGERLPLADTVRLMGEILAALGYAHGRGVVHRDVKPANVLLTAEGHAKLGDFGIARLENSAMTQLGTMMGTPHYMAPEQFRSEVVDARADLWAAGVLLYQLLTGEKPFSGGFTAMMHKALNTEPPAPSQLSVTAPPALDAVVARALAKRPDQRWPDANAFAEAIRQAAAAPSAAPAPWPASAEAAQLAARAAAPRRPRRPALALAGLGVLALCGGVAFLLLRGAPELPPPPPAPLALLPAPSPSLAPSPVPSLAAPPAPAAPPLLAPPTTARQPAADPPAAATSPPATSPPAPSPPAPSLRPDFQAALREAQATVACGLLAGAATTEGLRLEGVLPPAEAERLRALPALRDLPAGTLHLALQGYEAPLCPALAGLRPALAEAGVAPTLALTGEAPLRKGQYLRFTLRMPPWATHLHLAYVTVQGQAIRLEPDSSHLPGAVLRLGEPRPGFDGWEIDEPFGTDLLLALVSDRPVLPPDAPQVMEFAPYVAALTDAFAATRRAGGRVALRPVVVETAP